MSIEVGPALGLTADSKSLEAALPVLDAVAKKAGVAEVAADKLAGSTKRMGAEMAAATSGAANINAGMGNVTKSSSQTSFALRGVAQQLSQVAQQTMAGGGFMRALAIQLPDMAMGFGTVGIAVGVLAGVALPLLSTALGGNTEKAEANAAALLRLKDAQEAVTKSTITTQTEIDKLRFGVDEGYQVELLREQIRLRDEYNLKAAELNGYLATTTDSIDLQRIKTEQQRGDLERIAAAYKANADSLNRQADRAAQLAIIEGVQAQRAGEVAAKQRDAEAAAARNKITVSGLVGELNRAVSAVTALTANAPKGGWLNGAIADAQRLATALWDSAAAQAANRPSDSKLAGAYGLYGFTREQGPASKAAQDAAAAAKGGGGAAGGGTSALDTLVNELRTEQETLDLWRADNLAKISSYNDAELAAVGGQHEAKLRLEAEYQERLKAIIGQESNYRLTETTGMFSALAEIASVGGRKALKIQAGLSAAATMIAGYETAMKAAAEAKTIPGRIAAYAQFLGLGLKAASAIRTAGGAGGGSTGTTATSTSSAATTQAASTPQDVIIDYSATADPVMRALAAALVNPMIAQLQKASKTGINIVAVRT